MGIWGIPEQVSEYKKHILENSLPDEHHRPIVALGDSVTLVNKYTPEKRWPYLLEQRLGKRVINAGIGNTTSSLGLWRLERDVISLNPSLVIYCFLINDGYINEWETPVSYSCKMSPKRCSFNTAEIASRCRSAGIKVIIWTASPIGPNYLDTRLTDCPIVNEFRHIQQMRYDHFRETILESAKRNHIPIVDTYKEFEKTGNLLHFLHEDHIHHNEFAQPFICDLIYKKIKEGELV